MLESINGHVSQLQWNARFRSREERGEEAMVIYGRASGVQGVERRGRIGGEIAGRIGE